MGRLIQSARLIITNQAGNNVERMSLKKVIKMRKKKWQVINLLFFPCICLLLASTIISINWHVFTNEGAVMYSYLQSVKEGRIGYGLETVYGNNISFAELEPGDIILGGYPCCAYGRFSHAGVYIGNDQVIEGYADLGICVQSISHYRNYTEICLLRVNLDPKIKQNAVEYLLSCKGKLFYPVAFKPGERIWNCSKIIWKAYLKQGINLDPDNDFWIAPDVFYDSPYVSIISEKGQ